MVQTLPPRPPASRTVIHLPYDVLVDMFSFLHSPDLVNLLCSCRTLYALVGDESTWRSLSSTYGLRNIDHFGGRSWYTVYTRLLHTYGPMLGLWAGDHPYTGSVIEVGLQAGDANRQGGIIVELWRFRALQPEDLDGPETAEPPTYIPLATIDFSHTATVHGPPMITCSYDKRSPTHRAEFELQSPCTTGFYLHTRRGQYPHPDFPSAESHTWVDGTRYPRIRCTPSRSIDQTPHLPPHPRVPVVYAAPTSYRKPPALSISCSLGCAERARPFLGFNDISDSLPRFYPLRHDMPKHIEPLSPGWHPTTLVGVWLGSHGPHGTECLYVDWVSHPATLRAWKITGDENVPRGALTWHANMETPLPQTQSLRELCVRCLKDIEGYRFFDGAGITSGRGYM
ncbi:hypothetical protein VTO73DRAFT_12999 [Trametes versicolor]